MNLVWIPGNERKTVRDCLAWTLAGVFCAPHRTPHFFNPQTAAFHKAAIQWVDSVVR